MPGTAMGKSTGKLILSMVSWRESLRHGGATGKRVWNAIGCKEKSMAGKLLGTRTGKRPAKLAMIWAQKYLVPNAATASKGHAYEKTQATI